jgi:hypothetical protein
MNGRRVTAFAQDLRYDVDDFGPGGRGGVEIEIDLIRHGKMNG